MAVRQAATLLILPNGSAGAARVECVNCEGSIPVDMRSRAAVAIVEGLADVHECPAQADLDAFARLSGTVCP